MPTVRTIIDRVGNPEGQPPSIEKAITNIDTSISRRKENAEDAQVLASLLVGLNMCAMKDCQNPLLNQTGYRQYRAVPVHINSSDDVDFLFCRKHMSHSVRGDEYISSVYDNENAVIQMSRNKMSRGDTICLYGWSFVLEHCSFGTFSNLELCNTIQKGDEEPKMEGEQRVEGAEKKWFCTKAECREKALEWANPKPSEISETEAAKRKAEDSGDEQRKYQKV